MQRQALIRRLLLLLSISSLGLALPACETNAPPSILGLPDLGRDNATHPTAFLPNLPKVLPIQGYLSPKAKGPPYPLILVHGFFGFEKIGPFTYFHGVKSALVKDGHDVHIAVLDPFNSSIVRGGQLAAFVAEVLDKTGAAKVNLIAHSQGGLDARFVASQMPQNIGAIFTVAAPHLGDKLADILLGKLPGLSKTLFQAVARALGRPLYGDIAQDTDLMASMTFLATDSVKAFNAQYPDEEQVAYFSVGGRSGLTLAKDVCQAPLAPPFITQWAGDRDPVETLLVPTWTAMAGSLFSPTPNDGIVTTAATKWGTWLGCIPADHFDEVGQLAGDSPGLGNSFDHIAFYRHVASYLVTKGF
ncbi:MAG: alpha/beta fold hydrolase [Deltaproteobacteria bacterium]|nr:alpha/beta fold hydrolase [Deltaproteobacteria bacterium]